jgi:predicted secreted protein
MARPARWPAGSLAVLAAGLALAAGPACQADMRETTPPMPTVVKADAGRSFTLRPGQSLRVVLAENATTGYRWELERLDTETVELLRAGADYADPALGTGGNAVFVFRARRPGEARIVLKHWRPWEGEASTAGRFSIGIQVVKPE